jgi:cephalosporin hydroxylase
VSERVAPTIPLFHAEPDEEPVVRRFHDLYYGKPDRTWNNTFWRGVPALKCPLDLWIYQEIIFETKPDVIVETGTAHGDMCELAGNGRVTRRCASSSQSRTGSRSTAHGRSSS